MSEIQARRKKRDERRKKKNQFRQDAAEGGDGESGKPASTSFLSTTDDNIAKLLAQDEDVLLNFVVKVNKVYQEKLKRPAPFMTFVIW